MTTTPQCVKPITRLLRTQYNVLCILYQTCDVMDFVRPKHNSIKAADILVRRGLARLVKHGAYHITDKGIEVWENLK